MLPFRWDLLKKGFSINDTKETKYTFDERTQLKNIADSFGNWKRINYKIKDENNRVIAENYNEFTYFHDFVSRSIYDFDYDWKDNDYAICKYYEYQLNELATNVYEIKYLEKEKPNATIYLEKSISLEIKGITMHLYNTGVGVLSINLHNTKFEQFNKESILKINEFGRRMYPQFLNSIEGKRKVQEYFLPIEIKIKLDINEFKDDFYWYDLDNNINIDLQEPYRLPNYITKLFEQTSFVFNIRKTLDEDKYLITKITDDRMFFLSWYGDNALTKTLPKDYKSSDFWYAYIFGDKSGKSIANSELQSRQIEAHTYTRWLDYGTLFGMSRDSFVSISSSIKSIQSEDLPPIYTHCETIYYSIAILCLVQRASILKFTAEVTAITDLDKHNNIENNKNENENTLNQIRDLYKNYIEFVNKLYFREITSQIQGIEIYKQMHTVMNIDNEIKDLDKEINELHEYASLLQDDMRNKEASKLNKIATLFLPVTLFATIFTFFSDKLEFEYFKTNKIYLANLVNLLLLIIPSCVFIFMIACKKPRKKLYDIIDKWTEEDNK
jgi:hypothetical protein